MIYLYDSAIVDDLKDSFNADNVNEPVIRVVPPEDIISIAAQVQDDKLHFPLIALTRDENIEIDTTLSNFTRMHRGVATVFDSKKNELYYETAIPIKLSYVLMCIATNTADIDELIRELMFKYISQYFLSIKVPYESKRKIRFGISADFEHIEWNSTTSNYLQEGKLHSAGIPLKVDGAVMLNYTPAKLRRLDHEVEPSSNGTGKTRSLNLI